MPDIDGRIIVYKIEMLLEYPSDDCSQYLDWVHGVFFKIVNDKIRRVEIAWDSECVAEGDKSTTVEKMLEGKWNPKTVSVGAWREYLIK